jgi:hypothetical protein
LGSVHECFNQLAPQINALILWSVFEKTKFTYDYITFVIDNPYLPFCNSEMNNNPEFVMKFLNHESRPDQRANCPNWKGSWIIKQWSLNNFWWISFFDCFPFAAQMLIKGLVQISDWI